MWSRESGAESSYWDKWASESQVESSPGLGSQGSGRLGPSRHGRARGPGAPQQTGVSGSPGPGPRMLSPESPPGKDGVSPQSGWGRTGWGVGNSTTCS